MNADNNQDWNDDLYLTDISGIKKFKSIRRAIKRGLVAKNGLVAPKRPFNNVADKLKGTKREGKSINERRKAIYEDIKSKRR